MEVSTSEHVTRAVDVMLGLQHEFSDEDERFRRVHDRFIAMNEKVLDTGFKSLFLVQTSKVRSLSWSANYCREDKRHPRNCLWLREILKQREATLRSRCFFLVSAV